VELKRIGRKEIRELDTYKAIALRCGNADSPNLLTVRSRGPD